MIAAPTMPVGIIPSDMFAHFGLVRAQRPPAILVIVMVEWASLKIVVLRVLDTGIDLELIEVEELDALTLGNVASIRSLDVCLVLILLRIVLSWAEIGLRLISLIKVWIETWIHVGLDLGLLIHLLRRARHLLLHVGEVGLLL